MTKDRPPVEFLVNDEDYAKAVRSQKAYLRGLADRLERGGSLDTQERLTVVYFLRRSADQLSEEQSRPPGHAPENDPGVIAMNFAIVVDGMTRNKARAAIAETLGIEIRTVERALKKFGANAFQLVEGWRK